MDDDPAEEGVDGLLEASDRGASARQRGSGGRPSQERQQVETRQVCTNCTIQASPVPLFFSPPSLASFARDARLTRVKRRMCTGVASPLPRQASQLHGQPVREDGQTLPDSRLFLFLDNQTLANALRPTSLSRLSVPVGPSLMMQESCNREAGDSSMSAADIIAVGSNDNSNNSGKVRSSPQDIV